MNEVDIGREVETIIVTPVEAPEPIRKEREQPAPQRRPAIPRKEPVKPGRTPTRKPVKR